MEEQQLQKKTYPPPMWARNTSPLTRRLLFIVAGVLLVAGLAFAGYSIWKGGSGEDDIVFCTQDAMLCPDGSYVGRNGPNCEFAPCPERKEQEGLFKTSGTVYGKVSIGPLCPVEPCKNPPDVYSAQTLVFAPSGGGRPVDEPFYAPLSPDGSYSIDLPESNYSVSLLGCSYLGCGAVFPKEVFVQANKTVELNIDIDTGIR